jgi:hypothetical protein
MDAGYHQRQLTDTRNLHDLLVWLEYGKTSGYYVAARCSKAQEEHWAKLLRYVMQILETTQGRLLTEQDRIRSDTDTLETHRRLVRELTKLNYSVLEMEHQEEGK